jgi:hypothetical protein
MDARAAAAYCPRRDSPARHAAGAAHKETAVKTAIRSALAATLVLVASSSALAHCIVGNPGSTRAPLKGLTAPKAAFAAAPAAADNASVVGLWLVTFHIGDGPEVWDQAFEQFHSDGTELALDNAVTPAAGNVCVGVWERVGPRGAKLHHVGWNWDISVTPAALAGVFVLDMTVELAAGGQVFSGRYVTDSYDVDGNVIPELHAEGVVTGSRINVDTPKW